MRSRQRWYKRHQLFNQDIPPSLMTWLFDASSLTSRLISLCDDRFSVSVLSQQRQMLNAEETFAMNLSGVNSGLVRQVLLCCGDTPLVYARTIIPVTTIQGAEKRYANMGNRPLGAMLFADRTMQRESIQVAKLPTELYRVAGVSEIDAVWGRRSVFRVSEKPLLVCEYFLPELPELSG